MDEVSCPRCKTTKYRNPSLKLLVNVCGHSICESCVDLVYVRGSGKCDECGTILRRSNFRVQLFEDAFVEKEVDVRKRILRDFNKKEADFPSLREYNDYLEEVETIVFNLTNGIDVTETNEIIEKYRRENQETIRRNRVKQSQDELLIEKLIAEEQDMHESTQKTQKMEEEASRRQRQKQRDRLIDDLMFSELPADHILQQHRTVASSDANKVDDFTLPKKMTKFSSGIELMITKEPLVPVKEMENVSLYSYTPLEVEWMGPKPPCIKDIVSNDYLKNIRSASVAETAGGFQSYVACQRAIHDAFCGLQFVPSTEMMTVNQT